MPMYEYACSDAECGNRKTEYRRIEFRNTACHCDKCGGKMPRAIERPNVNPDLQPHYDENLCPPGSTQGCYVESRRQKRQLLKEYGLGEL